MDWSYYHIYNRGIGRRVTFVDTCDYKMFLSLLNRYLSPKIAVSKTNQRYPNYHDSVRLLAYCLMPNHFHLALAAADEQALSKFMQSLKTAYCRYFNIRHNYSGYVFESRYHKRRLGDSSDLLNITRYIHLNPLAFSEHYENYTYSSIQYYYGSPAPTWLKTDLVTDMFDDTGSYREFHESYIRELAGASLQV